MQFFQYKLVTLALCSGLLLAGCGGGGGGGSTSVSSGGSSGGGGTGGGTGGGSSNLDTRQTTFSNSYAAGSVERLALDVLNAERGFCGFGVLQPNAKLDTASKNHAAYLVTNNKTGHDEIAGLAGFTGIDAAAQTKAAGYTFKSALVAQVVTSTGVAFSTEQGVAAVRSLLSAPYHLTGMMSGAREVGLGRAAMADRLAFNLFLASASTLQAAPSNTVLTYPCQGSSNTLTGLFNETPNPIPNAAGSSSLSAGQPILIQVGAGQLLTIDSAVLSENVSGAVVSTGLLTEAKPQHDPSNLFADDPTAKFAVNQAVILPLARTAQSQYGLSGASERKAPCVGQQQPCGQRGFYL